MLPHVGPERFAVAPLTDVIRALESTGHQFDMLHCGRSDRAYFDWLTRLWGDGRDFCVVEQDVIVNADTLDELAACAHDWCGFPYEYMGKLTHGLGCVKFSAALIARNPDAMIRVGVMFDSTHGRRHWCRLDAWLQSVILPNMGEVKHEHLPPVKHLGTGCSHGCTT